MKKTVFYGLLVLLLAFNFVSCGNGSTNDNENEKTQSPYAGTWVSNVYQARMIIEGNTSLIAILQLRTNESSPWENAAKGSLVINGTNVTLTYTHIWKNNGWSDNAQDIIEMLPVISENGTTTMVGTVTGSGAGSILFEHLVKQ